ncbi:unnamed protein product [Polarella glacialis]|uniref:Uncharacterized protein n=1 Tax=Polarella glacialis TaxID=89957 RepID=A0A813FGP1_POLGL|nr:unnamed protein product [Polarella glacialis]
MVTSVLEEQVGSSSPPLGLTKPCKDCFAAVTPSPTLLPCRQVYRSSKSGGERSSNTHPEQAFARLLAVWQQVPEWHSCACQPGFECRRPGSLGRLSTSSSPRLQAWKAPGGGATRFKLFGRGLLADGSNSMVSLCCLMSLCCTGNSMVLLCRLTTNPSLAYPVSRVELLAVGVRRSEPEPTSRRCAWDSRGLRTGEGNWTASSAGQPDEMCRGELGVVWTDEIGETRSGSLSFKSSEKWLQSA